jgi:hypothetical protein
MTAPKRIPSEVVKLQTLELDPENLRDHETNDSIPALKKSLEKFGQQKNIVVHKNRIIAGNGMAQAAAELGWEEIEIKRVPDDWSSEKAQAYAIADNRTAELSTWHPEGLAIVLQQMTTEQNFELGDIGFDTDYLDNLITSVNKRNETPESFTNPEDDLKTDHTCPRCGYAWSGRSNPETGIDDNAND